MLSSAAGALSGIYDELAAAEPLRLIDLNAENTALIMVDIVNGFIREGAMSSENVEPIVQPTAELLKKCNSLGIRSLAFADCHEEGATEFLSFPVHCLRGSSESLIVDELKNIGGYTLVEKNSTNGFHEEKFKEWLESGDITDFIVVGDCTDICVLQFALSLRTWLNKSDRKGEVYLPLNMAETYDAPWHNADLFNLTAASLMKSSGVKIVSEVI